jgi:hypothetical protein
MIETKDITKMVHHIARRNRGVADPQIMHPMREWIIGIGVTSAGIFGGAVLAASLYSYYSAKKDATVSMAETVVPYNAAVVDQALRDYRLKQSAYEAVSGVYTTELVATTTEESSDAGNATTTDNMLPIESEAALGGDDAVVETEVEVSESGAVPDLAI